MRRIVLALSILALSASAAFAQAVTPDPVDSPAEAASFLYKLWKTGAVIPAAIVTTFLLLTFLSRKIAWLQVERRAMYISAILGGLAMLIEPASRGTTPNAGMIAAAFAAAVGLFLNPKKPSSDAAKAAAAL